MIVLGLSDGLHSGAALVVGERLVASTTQGALDRAARSKVFPWAAAEDVLQAAGLGRSDVDVVAVAGRFTPPLVLRRFPGLRALAGDDPFNPALDAHVAYQAALRWSGVGAFQEDQTAAWFHQLLKKRSFDPRRVVMVDMHRALAEAAYRSQPHDRVLAITAHPKADGAGLAVFQASGGLLVPLFRDSALSTLHTHLQRCSAAVGLDPVSQVPLLWALAGRGTPDAALVDRLGRRLTSVGRRPSRRAYPIPQDLPLANSVFDDLRQADPEVAAASVLQNLVEALGGVVRSHALRHGATRVVLGGQLFDSPRLVGRIADGLDVDELFVLPEPGAASLPLGAAFDVAGPAPRRLDGPGLGREYDDAQCELALRAAVLAPSSTDDPVGRAVDCLVKGCGVARFVGPGAAGHWGGGSRTVLVRADDPEAVARVRASLERDPREEAGCLWDGRTGDLLGAERVEGALRLGSVALRADDAFAAAHPAVIAPDGRVNARRVDPEDDPSLYEILERLRERTGCGALAAFALGLGGEPPAARPADAVRAWRRGGLPALLLGTHLVEANR